MCSVQCIAQELKQEPYTSILILSNKTCKQFYWEWLRENTKLPGLEITIAIMILQENDNICFVNVNSITNIIVYHDQHWIAKTHCGTDKSKHIYVTSFGEKQKKTIERNLIIKIDSVLYVIELYTRIVYELE